jgi:hypothetical protein
MSDKILDSANAFGLAVTRTGFRHPQRRQSHQPVSAIHQCWDDFGKILRGTLWQQKESKMMAV